VLHSDKARVGEWYCLMTQKTQWMCVCAFAALKYIAVSEEHYTAHPYYARYSRLKTVTEISNRGVVLV
jgi:hypothetical protein